MNGWWTLFRREIKGYLLSPIATIVVIVFLLLSGGLFVSQFFLVRLLDMRAFFDLVPILLVVVLPAVSMRIWAEDRQLNTLELLLSMPFSPTALVLGKFLAALAFFAAMLGSTWTIPAMLRLLGRPDVGPIVSGYLGVFLLGAVLLAVGQFVSGLCRDQIVAFIVGLFACVGLFLLGTEVIASTVDGWWPGVGGFLQQHVGVARHLAGFQKGVVDGRDIAYFLVLTGVFLALNGVWMEGRLRPQARAAFATACALSVGIALAAHGVLRHLPLGRFDWTATRAYTVAPVTRELLRALDVPATVTLYCSPPEKMPTALRTLERDVRDALDELTLASGGKLRYTVSHLDASAALAEPIARGGEPGGPPEATLERKGIRPFQVQSIEADELGVRLIYAAAAIAYKDRPEEVIPQLMPEMLDQIEYLLMSKLSRLTLEEPPAVALVAPYEQQGADPAVLNLLRQLGMDASDRFVQDDYKYVPALLRQEGYLVHRVRVTEQDPIPAGIQALVLIEPAELNERQRYEINRFLVEGGGVFLAAQRYTYQYEQRGRGILPRPRERPLGVDPLLEGWGVEVSRDLLGDEESRVLSMAGGGMGPFPVAVPVKAPVHLVIRQDQMNQQLSITSQLAPIFYLWGSPLLVDEERLKAQGMTCTTLMTSSARSWTVPYSPSPRLTPPATMTGRFPLAVWVRGTFHDQYAGQPIPDWPKPPKEELPEAAAPVPPPEPPRPISQVTPKPGQLLVIGCTELFKEELIASGGHVNFFLNAMDTLVSGGKLVTIRNKQPAPRVLAAPAPATKAVCRFLTLGLMPLLLVVGSVAWAAWRRRLRLAYARGGGSGAASSGRSHARGGGRGGPAR